MKKFAALILALCLLGALAACGGEAATTTATPEPTVEPTVAPEPVNLVIFAAASMTETMTRCVELYEDANPNVTIEPTFESSGTLKTQIEEGAYCDIYISASQKQMNALDITAPAEKNPDGLDFVMSETRFNLLENKVVLVVPEGNPAGINSFADIVNADLIAIGNSDVPVGSYSLEILDYLGIDVSALESAGKITYGSNVKEVTTQVSEGTVDCGIVYATDAYSAGLTVVDSATKEMCSQIIYPIAIMKSCTDVEAAQAFLDFLKTDPCVEVFEEVGFAMAG